MLMGMIQQHEKHRGKPCYGLASIRADKVRETSSMIFGSPTISNPFHADILLPPDDGKDFVMDITRKLAEASELKLFEGRNALS